MGNEMIKPDLITVYVMGLVGEPLGRHMPSVCASTLIHAIEHYINNKLTSICALKFVPHVKKMVCIGLG